MNSSKTNKRYILGFLLSAFLLCAISFFFEGKAFTNWKTDFNFTNFEFLISAIAMFVLEGAVFFFAWRSFKVRINWPVFGFCLLFMILAIVPIALFNGVLYNGELVGQFTFALRVRYILLAILLFTSLYEIIAIVPKLISGKRTIGLVFFVAILSGLVAVAYSYIFEANLYRSLFDGSMKFDGNTNTVPVSFTPHRNVYAIILFMALIGEAYFEVERPHWWRWPVMLFFLLNQLFLFSKTCMIIGACFFGAFWIFATFRAFKYNKVGRGIYLIFFALLIFAGFIFIVMFRHDTGVFAFASRYWEFFKANFYKASKWSFEIRFISVTIPFDAIKENGIWSLIFGFGYGNEYRALSFIKCGNASYYSIIDNSWGLVLAQNGFVGIAYEALIWGFGIYLIVRAFLRKSNYSWFYLFTYLCILGRTMTENDSLHYLDFAGVTYFSVCFLPMLVEEAALKVNPLERPVELEKPHYDPSLFLSKAFAISFLPALFLVCLARRMGYITGIEYMQNIMLRYGGIVFFAASPFILGGVLSAFKKGKTGHAAWALILYFVHVGLILIMPTFSDSVMCLIPEIAPLFIALLILSMCGAYEKKFFSIYTLFGNYVVFGIIVEGTYFAFKYLRSQVTLFALLAFLALYFVLWIFLYFMPRIPSFVAPFENDIAANENKYGIYRAEKEEEYLEHTKGVLFKKSVKR